jgi:histidine triad (HIT) family protein
MSEGPASNDAAGGDPARAGIDIGAPYDSTNVFARILRGEIPSDRVYEDDGFVAFRDIAPQAPTHIVLIPRGEPPTSPAGIDASHEALAGRMLRVAAEIARAQGLEDGGYRLVINCGPGAGQTVPHLHLHILGGAQLGALA